MTHGNLERSEGNDHKNDNFRFQKEKMVRKDGLVSIWRVFTGELR